MSRPQQAPTRLSEPYSEEWKDGYTTGMSDAENIATNTLRDVAVALELKHDYARQNPETVKRIEETVRPPLCTYCNETEDSYCPC